MWKKEVSFKRKPKAAAEAAVEVESAPAAPDAPKQSLLKKEISFSRKPKEKKESAPVAPAAPKQSFLKKEISFSRKKRDHEIDRLVHEATQSLSPSFASAEPASAETLPTALAEAAVAAMAQAEAQAQVEPAFVEHAPVELAPVEPAPVEQARVEPERAEPVALAAAPDPAPLDLHVVAPLAAEPPVASGEDVHAVPVLPVDDPAHDLSSLSPAILAASADEPAPVAVEPLAVEPLAPQPLAVEPAAWTVAAPAAEQAEPWLAAPALPPVPETAAVVIHPPVPAAELPPLPAAGANAPFWKKELSLSRKPKTPKAPKAERAPKATSASAPFWKKELSLGRKPAAQQEAIAADAPTETLPAAPTLPFWKKPSFSMPALSRPKRSSGGGKGGGHAVKKLVGLKIGSSQLAAARVSNNGVAEVQQLAREALAPGIVVGGELRDPEALGDALKAFFARNKLPRKGVRLGIASNRIGVRIFDIVGVTEEKQLANAIHFRAQEALPIPLDEAVLDFRVLDESVDEEGQTVKRVLLVVVYRELVERYVTACKKAGITLAGIDLEAFALLRSLAPPADRGSSALVGVSIGYDRSTFAVSDGRVCEFTRVLEWGGSAINVALARTFDSTPSEVEAIKRSLSLDESTVPPGLSPEQLAQAIDAVRRQVQSFARELVSSLQFYQNQPGSLGIGEIVLTGGTTHLAGLAAELERLIGVHVRVGDPFARVKVSKRLAGMEQSGSLAVAIGLGIED